MSSNSKAIHNNSYKAGSLSKTERRTRYLAVTAMLSAVSIVLMQFDFSVPLMPSFIRICRIFRP